MPVLALTYTALKLPFCVYLMTTYFNGLPRAILEAAHHGRRRRIPRLPRDRPPAVAARRSRRMATLNFLWLFNELLFGP